MRSPVLTTEELRRVTARLPRVDLAHLPTPLEEIPHFADHLDGPRLFIKRDDCTGLLFGGNKTRHNEFLLAEVLRQEADVVLWGGGVQSNNCRQTAAACAKLGLECRLVLSRASHGDDLQGNLLLDHLMGASVEVVDAPIGPELDALLLQKAGELRAAGRRCYVWERRHTRLAAAVSYALCLAEIVDEMRAQGREPSVIYICSAGPTGAGLFLGRAALGLKCAVRAISPIVWPWDLRADMAESVNQAAAQLGLPHRLKAEDIDARTDFVGPGYGQVTPAGWEAMDLLARTEGILLDPVYTSKAMAGLIHDVRHHHVSPGDLVVFIHTGGQPAVFAYRDELRAHLRR
jgi:1-aminocyclopropane-1-carboxylate deaminase/D-cysteine desulfhydrase-like pyridoxal-dependent ACC family enzyme